MAKEHDDPSVNAVVVRLMGEGWTRVELGHGFYLLCPCGDPRGRLRVSRTPQNPGNHARRLANEARRCPHGHELSPQPVPRGARD